MTPDEILDDLMCNESHIYWDWLGEKFDAGSEHAALFVKALNAADSIDSADETVLRDKCVAAMRELARMFRRDFADVAARKAEEMAE